MKHSSSDSFAVWDVFRSTYDASLVVMKRIIPYLPDMSESLRDALGKAVSSIPRSIARAVGAHLNGTASVHAARAHINDAIVLLSYCRDLHDRRINPALCTELLGIYRYARQQINEHERDGSDGRLCDADDR